MPDPKLPWENSAVQKKAQAARDNLARRQAQGQKGLIKAAMTGKIRPKAPAPK